MSNEIAKRNLQWYNHQMDRTNIILQLISYCSRPN